MKIKQVRLKNIGPHKDLTVNFSTGSTAILGSNGAGKSTLVNSIYAALTNDFSRFSSVKADIITGGSGKEQSFIAVTGSHRDQEFELVRRLRPNNSELTINGTENFKKANEINAAIEDRLGISKMVIDKYVFVNQWDMFQFLSQTDSERAKTFQYLCGTEVATRIHKVCADYVSQQKGVEIVDNSLEIEAAIAAIQAQMDAYAEEGRKAKKLILGKDKLAVHKSMLISSYEASKARLELGAHEKTIASYEHDRDLHEQFLTDNSAIVEKFASELALADQQKLDAARRLIDKYLDCGDLPSLLERVEKRKSDCIQQVADHEAVTLLVDDGKYIPADDRGGLHKWQGELEFQQSQDAALVVGFGHGIGDQKCSSCKQTVSADYINSVCEAFKKRQSQLNMLTANFAYSTDFDSKKKQHASKLDNLRKKLQKLEDECESLRSRLEDAPSREAYDMAKLFLLNYKTAKDATNKAKLAINLTEVKLAKIAGVLEQREKQAKDLHDVIAKDSKPEDLEIAEASVKRHEDATVRYKVAVQGFNNSKENRNKMKETLEQLRLRLKEKSKIRDLLETISEAGDVFHWNKLPKTVSQANLELLVEDINDNLTMFNHPFYVESDQDLTFKVFFPGKPPVKASQLSGGQKVVLAIAFRAALDRVFGHDVGMMFLDEPTAGLDADNVEYFHNALQQMTQKVHGDRQLVVITHVQELGGVFDQVIQL